MSASEPLRRAARDKSLGGRRPFWRRRWVQITAVLVLVSAAGLGLAAVYLLHHAEPIVRKRIVDTLAESFDGPIELDSVHLSYRKGLLVEGHGLRIPYGQAPASEDGAAAGKPRPLLTIDTFRFRSTVGGLLRPVTHVEAMQVEGVELRIPPGEERARLLGRREGTALADPARPKLRPKIAFSLGEVEATNAKLLIETETLGPDGQRKAPLEFDIKRIDLKHVGPNEPCVYTAELTNAKPKGEIVANGHIGPWNGTDPRSTPVDGDYEFERADLSTIRGIGGTLASTGHFAGPLKLLVVDGVADVPDFSLDVSAHPVPLHTQFHAHVNGVDGDTYLDRVDARLLASSFTTIGKVVKVAGQGHDISMDVRMEHGRIEDMLLLGVRTKPPLMTGSLAMTAQLHIPPGPVRMIQKLDLRGNLTIRDVHFTNAKFQDRVDGLSARAEGKPKEVAYASQDRVAEVGSQMAVNFALTHGLLTANKVEFRIPGATVLLHGVYSTEGSVFEFKGHARTEARASQMVGGWKGWLLKPLDPLLAKHGAGVELPIQVSGTQGDMHFGLAFGSADESASAMAGDLKGRRAGRKATRRAGAVPESTGKSAAENMTLERERRRQMFAAAARKP